jgi:hypothetical protein
MAETPKMDLTNWDAYKDWPHWTDNQWKQWEDSLNSSERKFLQGEAKKKGVERLRDVFDLKELERDRYSIKDPWSQVFTPASYLGDEGYPPHAHFDKTFRSVGGGYQGSSSILEGKKLNVERPKLEAGEEYLGHGVYERLVRSGPRQKFKIEQWEGPVVRLADGSIMAGDPRNPASQAPKGADIDIYHLNKNNVVQSTSRGIIYPGQPMQGIAEPRLDGSTTFGAPESGGYFVSNTLDSLSSQQRSAIEKLVEGGGNIKALNKQERAAVTSWLTSGSREAMSVTPSWIDYTGVTDKLICDTVVISHYMTPTIIGIDEKTGKLFASQFKGDLHEASEAGDTKVLNAYSEWHNNLLKTHRPSDYARQTSDPQCGLHGTPDAVILELKTLGEKTDQRHPNPNYYEDRRDYRDAVDRQANVLTEGRAAAEAEHKENLGTMPAPRQPRPPAPTPDMPKR